MIYAVIVNYNSDSALKALLKQLENHSLKTVVVDNASVDDSLYDAIELADFVLRNKKNELYAKAANRGIKFALKEGAKKILLLNFDLKLTDDFLEKLIESEADIAGPVIYYNKTWSRGGRLDIYEGIIEQ